jgi:hypothetical protein
MTEPTPIPFFNRNAIYSFVLALLALTTVCAGILPIPFTVLICYPPGIIFAVASLFLGIKSQRELRTDGKNGRQFAVISIWISGLSMFAFVCMIAAGAILMPRVIEYISRFIN